jgi:hypothetical protein
VNSLHLQSAPLEINFIVYTLGLTILKVHLESTPGILEGNGKTVMKKLVFSGVIKIKILNPIISDRLCENKSIKMII